MAQDVKCTCKEQMVAQLAKAADSECILFLSTVVTDVAIKPSLAHPDRASAFEVDGAGFESPVTVHCRFSSAGRATDL